MKAAFSLILALSILGAALPASAETIYMKNGTRVVGKIVKEDAETFAVETKDGRRKLPKREVETLPRPEPFIALMTGLLLPGGGQLYTGQYDRAALYLGLGAFGAGAGYLAATQIRYNSPSTAAVSAVVMYLIPGLIGAFDAATTAERQGELTRYRVEYDQ